MKNVAQILAEVEAGEKARSDAEFAQNMRLNDNMTWVFKQLNSPLIQSRFDHPHCYHLENGLDIEVTRGGRPVCRVLKEVGKMNLQVYSEGGADGTFDDPEEVLRRILIQLVRHHEAYSMEFLEEMRASSPQSPQRHWMA